MKPAPGAYNMALTDVEIRNAKPRPSLFELSDGGGLQLWVYPEGAKRWRMAHRFAGAQKVLLSRQERLRVTPVSKAAPGI
jgi:hypothetical protein